jgi:Flp pilus assembly protein TadG
MNERKSLNWICAELRRARTEEDGQALVEFALVIVFATSVIIGMIGLARAVYVYEFVAHAAREGSRYAMVRGGGCKFLPSDCPASAAEIQAYVKTLINSNGLDSSALADPQVSWLQGPSNDPNCSSDMNPGCTVEVQVTYNFQFNLPFFPTITYPMTSTSEMIISQ